MAASGNKVIAANYLGKIKTVFQMLMIIVYLIPIENAILRGLAFVLAYGALILTLVSGFDYLWKNKDVLNTNE